MKLTPCTSCARLVRVTDAACPFCLTAVAAPSVSGSPVARHLSRAAVLVGAAAIGAACGGTSQPVYGSPVVDSSVDDAKSDSPIAAYGGPPADAGLDVAPDSLLGAYGGPPFDASKQD